MAMAESEKDHKLPESRRRKTLHTLGQKKLIVGPRDKLTMLEFEQHYSFKKISERNNYFQRTAVLYINRISIKIREIFFLFVANCHYIF